MHAHGMHNTYSSPFCCLYHIQLSYTEIRVEVAMSSNDPSISVPLTEEDQLNI